MTRRGGVRRGGIWQFVAFVRAIVWRSVASIAGNLAERVSKIERGNCRSGALGRPAVMRAYRCNYAMSC